MNGFEITGDFIKYVMSTDITTLLSNSKEVECEDGSMCSRLMWFNSKGEKNIAAILNFYEGKLSVHYPVLNKMYPIAKRGEVNGWCPSTNYSTEKGENITVMDIIGQVIPKAKIILGSNLV